MLLSVIIPTHNRPARARETLEALAAQSLARESFEVIVVDDGSTEAHRQILREHQQSSPFIYLEKKQGGLASARNLGAEQAKGHILYFLDDDVIPAATTLAEHLGSHDRSDSPVAVVGSLPFPPSFKRTTFLWYLERSGHYDLYEIPDKYPGGKPPLPPLNGNSSLPRDVFFTVGAYDENFRQYGGEDLDLGYRLSQAGVGFVYNPAAIGHHNHEKDFAQFCIDMERAGESLIQLYRKHPEIKVEKKIDIVEDDLATLKGGKRLIRLIMNVMLACPWTLIPPRLMISIGQHFYWMRAVLFPLFRLVAHTHYARGMRRGLATKR